MTQDLAEKSSNVNKKANLPDPNDPRSYLPGGGLEESIEKLIYLMLNEYKQKMEP